MNDHLFQQSFLNSLDFPQLYEMKIAVFSSYDNLVSLCDTIYVCIVIHLVYIMYDAVIQMNNIEWI